MIENMHNKKEFLQDQFYIQTVLYTYTAQIENITAL